jgi:asparagine synthase (glutamine-hydrolysing)
MDGLKPFERWDDLESPSPEPVDDPLFAGLFDQFKMIAADCRVALCGEGADNLMHFEMMPYAKQMLRNRDLRRLLQEVPPYLRERRSIWPGVRRRFKGLFGKDPTAPIFPRWLAPEFARQLDLNARWNEWTELPASRPHPIRPKAHVSLSIPQWANKFEQESPGVTRYPVEVRYPFLDLRIVDYLLALPPYPFFLDKRLLRDAMVGRLPEPSRVRPKTPLSEDPLAQRLQDAGPPEWQDRVQWSADLDRYIDRSALAPVHRGAAAEQISLDLRPLCLNFWLQSTRGVRYNLRAEVRNA